MKSFFLISILALALFSGSCTKDMGGNADISTVDFVVLSGDWVEYGTKGVEGYGFAVDLNMPEITENVLQYGMVTLYVKSGEVWKPVPMTSYYTGFEGGFIYSYTRGIFSIDYYESDFQTTRPGSRTFRLVIVQPV